MAELLKNRINDTFFEFVKTNLLEAYPDFDADTYFALVKDEAWEGRELKARLRHMALMLKEVLPGTYRQQLAILMKAMREGYAFEQLFYLDFVEVFGVDDAEASLPALKYMTRYSTAEFAIRQFILQDPDGTMQLLLEWATDENFHVRRLASEGCRPRLPWAVALPGFQKDPGLVLPILEQLKADKEDYVYRSVANNLNDISKDHPELVLDLCSKWKGESKETDWVVKHACRTLLKKGHPKAMRLFGFKDPKNVNCADLSATKNQLKIGEDFEFQFEISSKQALGKLRLEYAIYFMKANGKTAKKVFSITENSYDEASLSYAKKHSFRDLTTRKHYPGEHQLALVVNGVEKGSFSFELLPK